MIQVIFRITLRLRGVVPIRNLSPDNETLPAEKRTIGIRGILPYQRFQQREVFTIAIEFPNFTERKRLAIRIAENA